MATFVLAFLLLSVIVVGMSLGVMLMGQKMRIKGSCGGLNAISGADKCVVCKKDIDPDSPLRDKIQCKRARQIVEALEKDRDEANIGMTKMLRFAESISPAWAKSITLKF